MGRGGASGGRGGRAGRSRSSHSSSSRSFSGRSRSSSTFGRGGGRAFRGAGPSGPSFRPGPLPRRPRGPRPPRSRWIFWGRPRTYGHVGYEGAGAGIFSVIVVLLIVLCCMFLMARPLDGGNSGAAVTVSTVNRDPLPADACIESDKWFEDHSGWITSDSVLIRGLRSFYQDTGVQPYVIITDQVNGKGADLSDGEAELYLEETYDNLFQDEGHLIFLFMEYETGQYKEYLYIGNQASSVIDEEAQEIIYDYADYYYTSDLDDNEYFSTVFEEAGQRIMRKTTTSKDILLGVVIAVSVIAVISVCGYVLVKKKQADAKEAEEKRKILETPIENMEDIELKEKYSDKKE